MNKQESKEMILAPMALRQGDEAIAALQEAITTNVAGGELTGAELPRIKISGGAKPCWIVPSLEEGDQMLDELTGVVVFARDTRVYYKDEFGKSGTTQPPDCSSVDCVTGIGNPGGECKKCPLAQFGSASSGKGQACKQVRQLFLLRGEQMLPEIVSLPPTSLKPCRQFFLKLTTKGIPYYQAMITIGLETTVNAAGIKYGRATFAFVRRLDAKEAARAAQYHALCRGLADRVATGLDPEVREHGADEEVPF